jgi:pimeloyl-ACP methyl ester carboxylesterase
MTEADLDAYAGEFGRTGFRGALGGYRSLHATWQLTAAWQDAGISVPALYIGGTRDIVLGFPGMRAAIEALPTRAPKAEPVVWIEGAGHFMQHEAADAVNEALVGFFGKVYGSRMPGGQARADG